MENTDKCETALHRALEMARMDARELDLARRTIQGGAFRTVAIIGFALASPTLGSDLLTSTIAPAPQGPVNAPSLSIYTHRDGAGAIVLHGENAR